MDNEKFVWTCLNEDFVGFYNLDHKREIEDILANLQNDFAKFVKYCIMTWNWEWGNLGLSSKALYEAYIRDKYNDRVKKCKYYSKALTLLHMIGCDEFTIDVDEKQKVHIKMKIGSTDIWDVHMK